MMASAPNYNDKNVQVYSVTAPDLSASSAPYASHIDAGPVKESRDAPTVNRALDDWEIGLCECFSVPAHCCMALIFPCFNGAYAAQGIGWSGFLAGLFFFIVYVGGVLFSISAQVFIFSYSNDGSTYLSTGSFICAVLFFAGVLVLRRQVRAFDRIPGSNCEDFCASLWCSCCVMSQLSAHTEKVKAKRLANVATLPAYHEA